MLDSISVTFKRLFKKDVPLHKETVKFIFEKSDNMSLWVIGISLGSISLLLAHFKDVQLYLSLNDIHILFLLFFASSICGIAHRIILIYYYIYLERAFRLLELLLSEEHRDFENKLNGNESFDDLLFLISQYIDVTQYRDRINAGIEDKGNLYNELVGLYVRYTVITKQILADTLNKIGELYHKTIGINKKKFSIDRKPPSGVWLNVLKWVSIILYLLFMISFLWAFLFFYHALRF